MEPITYQKKHVFTLRDPLLVTSICSLVLAANFLLLQLDGWQESSWAGPAFKTSGVLLMLYVAVKAFQRALPKDNFLRLEQEELIYRWGGKSLSWPWRELSAFALDQKKRRIAFTPSRSTAWRPGWASMRDETKPGQPGWIIDVYDAPIDEIAAKLNEHRERDLGSGRVPS